MKKIRLDLNHTFQNAAMFRQPSVMGPRDNNDDDGINAIGEDNVTTVAQSGKEWIILHVSFMSWCFRFIATECHVDRCRR